MLFYAKRRRSRGAFAGDTEVTEQGVGGLQPRHEGPLLAQSFRAVLALAQAHPIPRALDVAQHTFARAVQPGPRLKGTRGEPRHGPGVLPHPRVHHFHALKRGHGFRQELPHQQVHQARVVQAQQSPRVVEVARHHRPAGAAPLRSRGQRRCCLLADHHLGAFLVIDSAFFFFPPEIRFVLCALHLELVQHEKRAPRAPQLFKAGEHVGGGVRGHDLVQPQPATHHVNALQRPRFRKGGVLGKQRRAPDHRLHAFGSQGEHHPRHAFQAAEHGGVF
mmetsp:Transcript_65087/g.130913  ORF Transcript_65087/g.130913 Transcript_65087/m.130913 type:complete len:276 (-) Transcript_65087:913-1740(-)